MTTVPQVREVPFFNYRGAFATIEEPLMDTVRDVLSRGAFIMQRDLTEFERAIASYIGVKHAFGVGNATDGLILALRAAGLEPGDEVIVPSHTMVASPAAIHFAGGQPVLADIGPDNLVDPASIEAAITPRTRFVMPVHLNGRTCDMDAIGAIARRHDLQIVEDAAQGLGSRFNGRYAGSFGAGAAFSFYPAKILGCLGDGGLVVTNNDESAERIALLRDHGRNADGDVVMWGLNSRLDNLQAAILHLQFRDYDSIIAHRRALASAYQDALGDVPELTLPPAPDSDPRHFDVYQNYEIQAESRDELKAYLRARGIGTLIQWGGKAVHQFPALGLYRNLPATERFFARCLMLPLNLMVSADDVEYIAGCVRTFFRRA